MSNSTNNNKRMLLLGVGVLAIILVAYFGLMYPPGSEEDTAGTIGGVQKSGEI